MFNYWALADDQILKFFRFLCDKDFRWNIFNKLLWCSIYLLAWTLMNWVWFQYCESGTAFWKLSFPIRIVGSLYFLKGSDIFGLKRNAALHISDKTAKVFLQKSIYKEQSVADGTPQTHAEDIKGMQAHHKNFIVCRTLNINSGVRKLHHL